MKRVLFALALVVFVSATLCAQDNATRSATTSSAVHQTVGSHAVSYAEPAGLVKIFSNLGSKTDAFDYTNGWLILGPSSSYGEQQWIAEPFTPTKNHTATQIRAAMFYYSGGGTGNDFNFGIWSDASGVPGKELHGADKKNLPTWTGQSGDCCKTQNVTIKATKLKKGTQYWIAMTTDSKGTTSSGAWDYVVGDTEGAQASNHGSGWGGVNEQLTAAAVYGTK